MQIIIQCAMFLFQVLSQDSIEMQIKDLEDISKERLVLTNIYFNKLQINEIK